MTIALRARKSCDQHVGPKGTDDTHHVGKRNVFTAPVLKCFLRSFREAKVRDTREALLDAVVAVRCQQFQRADNAEFVEQPGAKFVLAAFAASERHRSEEHTSELQSRPHL